MIIKRMVLFLILITLLGIVLVIRFSQSSSEISTAYIDTAQSERIDEHLIVNNTLKEVNFCGKIYRTRQVIIDGIDIAQKIADLATNKLLIEKKSGRDISDIVCWNVINNTSPNKKTTTPVQEINISVAAGYVNEAGHMIYIVNIANSGFQIDSVTNEIYVMSAIGDSPALITEKLI